MPSAPSQTGNRTELLRDPSLRESGAGLCPPGTGRAGGPVLPGTAQPSSAVLWEVRSRGAEGH